MPPETAYCPAVICVPCTFATHNQYTRWVERYYISDWIHQCGTIGLGPHVAFTFGNRFWMRRDAKVNYQSRRGMLRFVRLIAIPLSFISISYIIKITFGYTVKSRIHNEWTCLKYILVKSNVKKIFFWSNFGFFFSRILSWLQIY